MKSQNWGGARPNSGPKFKWGKEKVVRVIATMPPWLVDKFRVWLDEEHKKWKKGG